MTTECNKCNKKQGTQNHGEVQCIKKIKATKTQIQKNKDLK